MTVLPSEFLTRPLAHRGYHNLSRGVPENSLAAFRAAIEAGYGIELDIQASADQQAMVFHDDNLDRLTAKTGPLRAHTAAILGAIRLTGGSEGIPTLPQVLDLVAGRVPLLIEIKDQDGAFGAGNAALGPAVARALETYSGPVAVMSFNPHAVAAFTAAAPGIPIGLTTEAWLAEDYPDLPEATRAHLRAIPDYEPLGACFISHHYTDLTRPRVAELQAKGARILCWTIRSAEQEAEARKIADNITFEHYPAPIPPS